MKIKQLLASTLAILMILTLLAACGDGDDGTTSAPTPDTSTNGNATPDNATPDNAGEAELDEYGFPVIHREPNPRLQGLVSSWHNYGLPVDPITLTICTDLGTLPNTGIIDTMAFDLVREATGITLDWIGVDEERFAVLAAGGDLPDIVMFEASPDMTIDVINAGTVIRLDDLIEQYGWNIQRVYEPESFNNIRAFFDANTTREEGIFSIPNPITNLGDYEVISPFGGGWGGYLRFDIYSAIGAPLITDANGNFDEDLFLDVLEQMVAYNAEHYGIENSYALSGWFDWGVHWTIDLQYTFMISGQYYGYEDTRFWNTRFPTSYADPESPRWDAARFFNNAYRRGIFDPEAFILPWSEYENRFFEGMYLMCPVPGFASGIRNNFPDAGLFLIRGMPWYDGLQAQNSINPWGTFSSRAINISNEYPERTMALFDYMVSDEFQMFHHRGVYGFDWEYGESGVPRFINNALARFRGDPDAEAMYMSGGELDRFMVLKLIGVSNMMLSDGYPANFGIAPDFIAENFEMTPWVENFFETYDAFEFGFPGAVYMNWVETDLGSRTNRTIVEAGDGDRWAWVVPPSDDMNLIQGNVDNYIFDNIARLVLANSEAEFDAILNEIISTLIEMGEPELWADWNARVDESERIAREEHGFNW